MSDELNLGIDPAPIKEGVDKIVSDLSRLRDAFDNLGENLPRRIRKQLERDAKPMKEIVAGITQELASEMSKAQAIVEQAGVKLAGAAAKGIDSGTAGAKEAGRKAGKAYADGMEEAAARVRTVFRTSVTGPDGISAGISGSTLEVVKKQAEATAASIGGVTKAFKDLDRVRSSSASNIDPQTLLGLTPERLQGSARASASVFRDAFAAEATNAANRAKSASNVDVRTLLGLTPDILNGSAAASAEVFKAAFAQEAATASNRTKSASNIDVRTLLGLSTDNVKGAARASAEVFQAAFATEAQRISRQVRIATNEAAGPFTALTGANTGKVVSSEDISNVRRMSQESAALAARHRELAAESYEVRSAFRGIAGAAGALFLTYGSLIPLTAAFAAASGVKEAIVQYKDLENQLNFIRALSQEYDRSLQSLAQSTRAAAVEFGVMPVEAAKGLRALVQAGLSLNDAVTALPAILRLATIGEISVGEAAVTATGAVQAFGLSFSSISRVSDVFVAAAKSSNASVASIAESMKQASSVAEEYKVSVEDVGVVLAALGKKNITGSAAGTAFRNLMSELAAPRGEAQKVAKQLKLSLFDPLNGSIESLLTDFIPKLRKTLAPFDPQSQSYILNRLFNERGSKAINAILSLGEEGLRELRSQIDNAKGLSIRAAIEANDTIQGDLNKLRSQVASTFGSVAEAAVDPLRSTLQSLRSYIASDEFKSALTGVGAVIQGVASAVGALASVVGSPTGAVAVLAAGTAATLLFATQMTGTSGAVAAFANGLAFLGGNGTKAAGGIARVAELAGSLLKYAAVAVVVYQAAVAIGELYTQAAQEDPIAQAEKNYARLSKSSDDFIEKIKEEIKQLEKANRLKRGEGTATTFEELTKAAGDIERYTAELNALRNAPKEAVKVDYSADANFSAAIVNTKNEELRIQNLLNIAQGAYAVAAKKSTEANVLLTQQKNLQLEADQRARDEAKKSDASGTKKYNIVDADARRLATSHEAEVNRRIQLEQAGENQRRQALEAIYQSEERDLKRRYDQNLITFDQYRKELTAKQEAADTERYDSLKAAEEKALTDYKKIAAAFVEARAKGAKQDDLKVQNDLLAAAQRLDSANLAIDKQREAAFQRRNDAMTNALRPGIELLRVSERDAEIQKENVEQELVKLGIKGQQAQLSERDLYVQLETQKILNAQLDEIKKIEALFKQLGDQGVFNNLLEDDAARKLFEGLTGRIRQIKDTIVEQTPRIQTALGNAFDAKKIQEFAKELNDKLVDALTQSGKGGGKRMRKVLEEELLRKPFAIVLKAILEPITQGIAGTAVSTAQGILGSGNNLVQGASNASSLLSIGSGYSNTLNSVASILGAGNAVGASAASLGYANAVGALGGDSLGALIAANGSWGGVAGAGAGTATAGGLSAVSSTLAAIPGWGWAAMAAIAAFSIFGDDGGGPKVESAYGPGVAPIDADSTAARTISEGIQNSFSQIAQTLGLNQRDLGVGVFSSRDPEGDAPTALQVHATLGGRTVYDRGDRLGALDNVGRSDEEYQAALVEETNRVILGALQASDLAQKFKDYLAGATDISAAVNTVVAIRQLDQAFKNIGGPLADLTKLSVEAEVAFVNQVGGLQNLTTLLNQFYQDYYTDAERNANATKQLSEALDAMGLQLPSTRAEFRKLVEQQDLTTESGRANYIGLLNLSAAFAAVVPQVDALTEATDELTGAARSAADIASERDKLEEQLLQLQGNAAALRLRERSAIDASNLALFDQIAALQDAQAAQQAAAEQAKAIEQERANIEQQILQATGDTAAIRAAELAALDPANRALQQSLYARQDELAAIEENKRAMEEAQRVAEAIASERTNLEGELLQAQNDTIAIRVRELAALDPSNRAIKERIYALQDEAAALDRLKTRGSDALSILQNSVTKRRADLDAAYKAQTDGINARRDAANALTEARVSSLQSQSSAISETGGGLSELSNALQAAIDSLRESLETPAQAVAEAQRQIADALNTAQNGGLLPTAQSLQKALNTLTTASTDGFASGEDYARFKGVTAAQLTQLQALTGEQQTVGQETLNAINTQIQVVQSIGAATQSAFDAELEQAKAAYDDQVAALDELIENAKSQLDAALGQTQATLSLTEAMNYFGSTVAGLALANAVAISANQAELARIAEVAGAGAPTPFDATAGVPVTPTVSLVPLSMIVQEQVQAQQAQLDALIEEVKNLRADVRAGDTAIATSVGDTARVVKNWERSGGVPIRNPDNGTANGQALNTHAV